MGNRRGTRLRARLQSNLSRRIPAQIKGPQVTEYHGDCDPHAIERMFERYGIELCARLQSDIHRRIQSGRANLLGEPREGAGVYILRLSGQKVGIVYHLEWFRILTVLPATDLRVVHA